MFTQSIAVIMSVYKSDELANISVAVDSILTQKNVSFVFYIYRDGVVGSDLDIYLKSLSVNPNVRLFISECNRGLANALNCMISAALTDGHEFIARMDSDDISYPERLLHQVLYMNAHPDVDVLGCACREFGADYAMNKKVLPLTHDELYKFSILRCPFIHPTVMFRATVFTNGIRYPVDTSFTEDMALWFDLLDKGYRFANLEKVLLDYRVNIQTLSRRKGLSKAISEFKLRWKYMLKLRCFSFHNLFFVLSRFVFHLLPVPLIYIFYKKFR